MVHSVIPTLLKSQFYCSSPHFLTNICQKILAHPFSVDFSVKALITLSNQALSVNTVSGWRKAAGALMSTKCRLLLNISLRKEKVMGCTALGKLLIQPLGLNALWPFTLREREMPEWKFGKI